MVRGGSWTIDRLFSAARNVISDFNGDNVLNDSDRLGIKAEYDFFIRSRARSKKASEETANKKQAYEDTCGRNALESVFGVSKRKYCLDRIIAHLEETTKCLIAMNFFVLNTGKKLRLLFIQFLKMLFSHVFSSRYIHILYFA